MPGRLVAVESTSLNSKRQGTPIVHTNNRSLNSLRQNNLILRKQKGGSWADITDDHYVAGLSLAVSRLPSPTRPPRSSSNTTQISTSRLPRMHLGIWSAWKCSNGKHSCRKSAGVQASWRVNHCILTRRIVAEQ